MVIPKSTDEREVRAESIRVESFGLSVLSNYQRTNITLGYSDDTMVLVRGNACVAFGQLPGDLSFRPKLTTNHATKREDKP